MPPAPDSILIVGTGAMACLFGGRLAPHADVTLLGTWPEGVQALRRDGIRLETEAGESRHRIRVTSNPADVVGVRHALVLVKSWQTRRAARQLADCLAPEGVVLTLQNGLGNLDVLVQVLGSDRAALGVTTSGATLLGPGRARAGGAGPVYLAPHPRLVPIADLLRASGFAVEEAPDVEGLLWGKLAVNAAINPLTALLQVPNGELLERPHARELMAAAAMEVADVAAAMGIDLPMGRPDEQGLEVARRTAANRSSMLQDVARQAPTEIDAICGAVVDFGRRKGVATPVNFALWSMVRALVDGWQRAAP
ncbi:MAG: ketopantoate reductase family protein [Anaerolineales bacterium]